MTTEPDWPERVYQGVNMEKWKGAEEELHKAEAAVKRDPKDAKAQLRKAVALYRLNRTEAITTADMAVRLDGSLADAHYIKGTACEAEYVGDEGLFAEAALVSLTRAIQLDGKHWNAMRAMGNILIKIGKWDNALNYFERGLAVNPNNPGLHMGRGRALTLLGRHEDAIASLERCMELEPNNLHVHIMLAAVLLNQGKKEESLKALDRAVEINPVNPMAYVERSRVLELLGQKEEARRAWEKATDLDPRVIDIYFDDKWLSYAKKRGGATGSMEGIA